MTKELPVVVEFTISDMGHLKVRRAASCMTNNP
jgi:hypothetical protein